jgi:hypothetical protein
MQWTVLWFEYQSTLWGDRSKREDSGLVRGHKAYSIKQQKLWNTFKRKAAERFAIHLPLASK